MVHACKFFDALVYALRKSKYDFCVKLKDVKTLKRDRDVGSQLETAKVQKH